MMFDLVLSASLRMHSSGVVLLGSSAEQRSGGTPWPPAISQAELVGLLSVPKLHTLDAVGRRGIAAPVWSWLLRQPQLRQLRELRIGCMKNMEIPVFDSHVLAALVQLHALHTLYLLPVQGHDIPLPFFQHLHRLLVLTHLRCHAPMRFHWSEAPPPTHDDCSALVGLARCPLLCHLAMVGASHLACQWLAFCHMSTTHQSHLRTLELPEARWEFGLLVTRNSRSGLPTSFDHLRMHRHVTSTWRSALQHLPHCRH